MTTQTGRDTFTVLEIIEGLQARGTAYPESTIRTHVTSLMCANAPLNHAIKYNDLERVGHGDYRLITGLKWAQIDFISVLGVAPEIDEFGIIHFAVTQDDLRLVVSVEPRTESIFISLYKIDRDENDQILFLRLVQCSSARRIKHRFRDYLMIVGPKSFEFGKPLENSPPLPVRVQIEVRPHIGIHFSDA